jgi:integrase
MRVGEALGLEWTNVDLGTGRVHIERQTNRVPGHPEVHLVPLKTKAARRPVILPPQVRQALRWHADRQRSEQRRAEAEGIWEDHGVVLCGPTGQLYFRSQPNDEFRRITTRLGITGASLHTFRHTAVTLVQASGVPLRDAQALVGHETDRTTNLIYTHATHKGQQRVAETTEAIFASMRLAPTHLLTTAPDPWNTDGGGQPGGQTTTNTAITPE